MAQALGRLGSYSYRFCGRWQCERDGRDAQLFVTAMTFEPVMIPLESDPALAVILAPALPPPDWPGLNVTIKACGSVVPLVPVCASPLVLASDAAGLPTTIQPP